ncbi:MAG: CCA tRNA nucleotidyltransferase [Elusimicrobia bacterium]|nr:CCA tRNA nucleotidyltransferase [Elusimicrobiota bacterium]
MPRPEARPRSVLAELGGGALLEGTDLDAGLIKAASAKPFEEAPLLILRAFRAAAELGLGLDEHTRDLFRTRRSLLAALPAAKVRDELLELLAAPQSSRGLRLMDECRVLTALFPELEPGRKCAVEYYGQGGVMTHTLSALDRAAFLLERLPQVFPGMGDRVRGILGSRRRRALFMLTVLLHDVAKPGTARRVRGRLRFFGHDAKGASEASAVLKRLRLPKAEIAEAAAVIRHHLRPGNLAASGRVTDRASRRFLLDTGPAAGSLLLAAWADHASYLAEEKLALHLPLIGGWTKGGGGSETAFPAPEGADEETSKTLRHLWTVAALLARLMRRPEQIPERLVDGGDVMKLLGLEPGPEVGKVLAQVAKAQANGRLSNRQEALAFVSGLSAKQRRNKLRLS